MTVPAWVRVYVVVSLRVVMTFPLVGSRSRFQWGPWVSVWWRHNRARLSRLVGPCWIHGMRWWASHQWAGLSQVGNMHPRSRMANAWCWWVVTVGVTRPRLRGWPVVSSIRRLISVSHVRWAATRAGTGPLANSSRRIDARSIGPGWGLLMWATQSMTKVVVVLGLVAVLEPVGWFKKWRARSVRASALRWRTLR